jgi:Fe-S-cluster-containing hydrogenase component 2
MACSFENYGTYATAKSRIKVFDFHHTGRKVPYTCTQCDEAWCLHACPVEAITVDKATGAKVVNESTCVGCKVCTIACPFGTINYVQETGKVQKCDLCGGDPACADACPTGAITFIDANWTGLGKMAAVGRQAGQPTHRLKENNMSWAGKILRVNLTAGTVKSEPLNMDWAGLPRLARPGHQVPGRRSGCHGRPAVCRQQDHLGHRPADRHHGLHRRPLHRHHQGPADRGHCLLQLGRLLGCRAEDGRLGHGHF